MRRYLLAAVTLMVLLVPAAASRAAVSITGSRVEVGGRGATAIIDRPGTNNGAYSWPLLCAVVPSVRSRSSSTARVLGPAT
jgi:hypothetical protein